MIDGDTLLSLRERILRDDSVEQIEAHLALGETPAWRFASTRTRARWRAAARKRRQELKK